MSNTAKTTESTKQNDSDDSLWASGHCFRSAKRVPVFDTQLRLFGFGLYDGRVLVSVFFRGFGTDCMPSRLCEEGSVGSCVNCRSSRYNYDATIRKDN